MKGVIEFSIRRSLFVNLMAVFFLAAGVISLMHMRREAFPNVNYDVVTVQTSYFGAPAQEIEKLITIKLEEELKEVDGIDEMLSVSSENNSVIVLQLDPDEKDKRKVVNDIQRAVDRTDDLPANLEDDPIVTELESKNFPIINASIAGPVDEVTLQKYARELETRFLDLPGVAKVSRIGWRDREIWVEVKPDFVDEYKMSLQDVAIALANQNMNVPAGTLDTKKEGEYLVRTIGEFETAEEVRKVIIRANDVGNWIRVKDVAEVKDTFEDDDLFEKTQGERAITLTVVKKQSADIIDLVGKVKDVAEQYKKSLPPEIRISFFDDFSFYVKRRLNVLVSNGAVGIVLVTAVLFLFMSGAPALATVIGLPVAFAMTFFMMNCFGLTINLVTMFALIMVLGIIVDDAIVIAENSYRYVEAGLPPREAALRGASEVATPVISTVLTTVAAFVPIFFMHGIVGKFVFVIPLVAIAALSASLIESMIILPSHLAEWIRPETKRKRKSSFVIGLQKLRIFYLKKLRWVVHHRYKALMVILGVFVGSFILMKAGMKFVLFPQGMIEEFFIQVRAPIGTSLAKTEELLSRLEKIVAALPADELENYVTQVGIRREDVDDPYASRGSNIGQMHIFLTPEIKRKRKADEIIADLRKKSETLKEVFEEIKFVKVRSGPPLGKPVNVQLRGDSLEELEAVAEEVKQHLHTIKGAIDIEDDFEPGKKELRVIIQPEEARKAFVSVRAIADAVRSAIDGKVATTIQKTDEEIDVIVRYPEPYRKTREIFDRLFIPNDFGNLIALNKVTRLDEEQGIQAIKRLDGKRMIQVTSDVDEKVVTSVEVQKIVDAFYKKEMAPKHPNVTVSYGGEQKKTAESMDDFFKAFLLALFLIFIILAYNFNSILQPLLVMLAIPFGLVGVILAFFLHGWPMSFMAILGTIGLSGVVVNDSIVLVDFINARREEGHNMARAVFGAGRLRLRPVMLTTVTTVAGLLPVAYGIGGSDPFVKPMALAIGWGLFFATVLTLLVIPCMYIVGEDIKDRLRRVLTYLKNGKWIELRTILLSRFRRQGQ